jgi:alpha-L-arabinofuranosidase
MHHQLRQTSRTIILVIFSTLLLSLQSLSAAPFALSSETTPAAPTATTATIRVDATDAGIAINPHVLGTNLPAWISKYRMDDATFRARTIAAGTDFIRIPGGSWSNAYDWLACERNGQGIAASAECYWLWAARPTDFINFLRATDTEGIYTVNMNGTAHEAAALVAFFNGTVDDTRPIGVDVRGRDWLTVGDWARLRRDHGNAAPLKITYWEVGNEFYGGKSGAGTDCSQWGWEDVWTCDGMEYINGIGSDSERREGFREFRTAMQTVDPTIRVGAIGVSEQAGWSNWGNEVIAAAGAEMDFYNIHQYAYFDPPGNLSEVLAEPQATWPTVMADVQSAFERHAGGRDVPVAITEYNLFAFQDNDTQKMMDQAINLLHLTDTIGQMMENGVAMANQWALANGTAWNGTDYGLMEADGYARNPQYYAFPLWSRFGTTLLPVTSSLPADTTLSVYAGRIDAGTISLLAINKTDQSITGQISLNGVERINRGTADVVKAAALTSTSVTFNGQSNPSDDLSNAPATALTSAGNPLSYTFEPYAVTLLRIDVTGGDPQPRPEPTDWLYLPLIIR